MAYRCALITGASSGIGEAFARALPAETNLLVTGRDQARLDVLAKELSEPDRQVVPLAADLTSEAGRSKLLAAAAQQPIDLLVNNAGLGRLGAFAENPVEREREMVELNCLAPVLLTRSLLPAMLDRAKGGPSGGESRAGIILVSSTAAFVPLPGLSTYSATKAFDLYLAEGLAGELKDEPVDVLALCPGATRTRFFERAGFHGQPMGAISSPQAVAEAALRALGRQPVLVVGGANKALTAAAGLLPRSLTRQGARTVMSALRRRSR